jgi:hypothetical protein
MVETQRFRTWLTIETARRTGKIVDAEEAVARAMAPQHLRVEVKDRKGRWYAPDVLDPAAA